MVVFNLPGTLPAHVEVLVNQHPQILVLRAAVNPFSSQFVFVHVLMPILLRLLSFHLIKICFEFFSNKKLQE